MLTDSDKLPQALGSMQNNEELNEERAGGGKLTSTKMYRKAMRRMGRLTSRQMLNKEKRWIFV